MHIEIGVYDINSTFPLFLHDNFLPPKVCDGGPFALLNLSQILKTRELIPLRVVKLSIVAGEVVTGAVGGQGREVTSGAKNVKLQPNSTWLM